MHDTTKMSGALQQAAEQHNTAMTRCCELETAMLAAAQRRRDEGQTEEEIDAWAKTPESLFGQYRDALDVERDAAAAVRNGDI